MFPITALRPWAPLAVSDDSQTMIFSQFVAGTRISRDGGSTWNSAPYLVTAAVSANGDVIVGAPTSASNLKLSIDGGTTFNDIANPSPGSYVWSEPWISGDGMVISAKATLNGSTLQLYVSCDQGGTLQPELSHGQTGQAANRVSGNADNLIVGPGFEGAQFVLTAVRS